MSTFLVEADSSAPANARARGSTFVELLFAIAIVGVTMIVQVQQITITLREHTFDLEAQFAFHKASAMLAELQASVDQGAIASPADLEAKADSVPNPVLTTRAVASPAHVMSGNTQHADGTWQWARKIEVEPIEGAQHGRFVRVRVLSVRGTGKHKEAAVVSGVLNITVRTQPSVHEYDVYMLALAEAPSTWQPLPALRAQMQAIAGEIESTNPNLRLRLHWITSLGYGRDPTYLPYVNEAVAADAAAPWVYWYPGKLAPGAGASVLYSADLFGGRVRTEAGIRHDFHSADNPYPYAVADRHNHCVRTPEARAIFAQRVAAGLEEPDAPPLQVLLADMFEQPERYQNAIFINLHGDGLPFPPLRNYADAAKDPVGRPGVRVVTHPSRLHTPSDGISPLEFRVYGYRTDPLQGAAVLAEPVTLQIFGGDFTGDLVVERQAGGVDIHTGTTTGGTAFDRAYSFGAAPRRAQPHAQFEMNYEVGYATSPAPHTWLRLYNTPLRCAPESSRGIQAEDWLYGTDYIPSPVKGSVGGFFAMTNPSVGAKNTVRWRVQIPAAALARVFGCSALVTATTRIGADTTTGVMWPAPHQPTNVSTTFAWWSPSKEDVPITERYQFLGDPRHNPYLDLCAGGASFPHGYNWWFDNLHDACFDARPQWTSLDGARLRDGFGRGTLGDVPRMLQVWREALQRAGAVLVNPGGPLAGRVLLGGEVLLPNEAPVFVHGQVHGVPGSSVPCLDDLAASGAFDPPSSLSGTWSSLLHQRQTGRVVVRASDGFLAKPWLGELAPDSAAAAWQCDGNLATAAGFLRAPTGAFAVLELPRGTSWDWPVEDRLGDMGGASLLQGPTASHAFTQFPATTAPATQELTASAHAFAQAVGVAVATKADGTWAIDVAGRLSASLPHAPYASEFATCSESTLLESLSVTSAAGIGAAVLRTGSAGSTRAGYVVPFADRATAPEEHRALAQKAFAFGLRALMVAGEPHRTDGVGMQPGVAIELPLPESRLERPTQTRLRWTVCFARFDGKPYTERYPSTWNGSELDLEYVVTYRRANGSKRHYALDHSEVIAGEPPPAAQRLVDTGAGAESLVVDLPADRFPAGQWALRVDCYRRGVGAHLSHHEVLFEVRR